MSRLKLLTNILGPIQTNCYTLVNEETKEALIIDAAGSAGSEDAETLADSVKEEKAELKAVLLTHGHYDHIGSVAELRKIFPGVPVYIGEHEKDFPGNPMLNLSVWLAGTAYTLPFQTEESEKAGNIDRTVQDGEVLSFLGTEIRCLEVPGHTAGSICYYLPEMRAVFCGDTLFCGSVGRTDFPTGNEQQLLQAIREKLFTLPEETVVYPGHGAATTIRAEKTGNFCFD